jgi:DNA methylase
MQKRRSPRLNITDAAQAALVKGARDLQPVSGLTHNFYRYPARFSPGFARAAVEAFTEPGDYVLDPFVGGGTSLVEAVTLGRNAVGVDISQLAEFIASVKTAVMLDSELRRLAQWAVKLPAHIHIHHPSRHFVEYTERGYYKHLNHPSRWRLRKAIDQALRSALRLGVPQTEAFARCVVLRTAQWALDGRKRLPSVAEFREALSENAVEMINAAREFRDAMQSHSNLPSVNILNRSATGLEEDHRIISLPAPKLVVTSPPYPGVHILYHRWQIAGGKEAPLPFMIANKLDGAGSSYYTMGDRHYPELATYFDNLSATMSSVVKVANDDTIFVQMVAFSDPRWQLPRYLETMERVGLLEICLPALEGERDGRLWRSVPGRRWYSDQRGETPGSQEVVLIHRKRTGAARRPSRQDR